MSGMLVTRASMVDIMKSHYSAGVIEQPAHNWRRLNLAVVDQNSGELAGDSIDFHLLEICLAGKHHIDASTELETGDRTNSILIPGAINYVQPLVPSDETAVGNVRLLQLYIDDSVFREVARGIAPGDPDNAHTLGRRGAFDPDLRRLAALLLDEARSQGLGGELYSELIAQQIAFLILRRRLEGHEKKLSVNPLADHEVARVIDFIEANLEEVGGMDTLAKLIDMDVFSFTRAFKAKTGEAPHQFLIGRRLAHVKDMLLNTDLPLAEITYAAGFSNQSHMTTTFSKHFGMPPGAWRKMVKS